MVPRETSQVVDIYYKLTDAKAWITLAIETNAAAQPLWQGVRLPDECVNMLTGDVAMLIEPDDEDEKHIVWNVGDNWPGQSVAEVRPVVAAWAQDNPPLYLVADLGGCYQSGTVKMLAYTSEAALPYGGLSNDIYRSNLLVMRRIEAGTFWMGSHTAIDAFAQANENWHEVTLTNDFYIGVFEVTQRQWQRVMDTTPSKNNNSDGLYDSPLRPVESINYQTMRGGDWPTSDVTPKNTFINRMRAATALRFDLPTEAQWEYACRAGTQTALYNNLPLTTTTALCPNREPLAWDAFTAGAVVGVLNSASYRHHRVGEKLPNAWGLYDMLGNVNEIVRDWYVANLGTAAVVEPVGPANGSNRVRKGGAYNGQRDPRAAYRNTTTSSPSIGLRLALVPWAAGEWSWTEQ